MTVDPKKEPNGTAAWRWRDRVQQSPVNYVNGSAGEVIPSTWAVAGIYFMQISDLERCKLSSPIDHGFISLLSTTRNTGLRFSNGKSIPSCPLPQPPQPSWCVVCETMDLFFGILQFPRSSCPNLFRDESFHMWAIEGRIGAPLNCGNHQARALLDFWGK